MDINSSQVNSTSRVNIPSQNATPIDDMSSEALQDNTNPLQDDITEIIINLLNDYGYAGIDALNQLSNIYQTIQDRSIKNWVIDDENKLLTLKDSIWYNFEYLPNNISHPVGKASLNTLGSKFPIFATLFIDSAICSKLILPSLLSELECIKKIWHNNIYLVNIASDIDVSKEAIIFYSNESPIKYSKDVLEHTTDILDASGNNIKIDAKQYIYVIIQGQLNSYEQSNIYFSVLESLYNTVKIALRDHKDLRLIIQ